jgi:hypothetical protein
LLNSKTKLKILGLGCDINVENKKSEFNRKARDIINVQNFIGLTRYFGKYLPSPFSRMSSLFEIQFSQAFDPFSAMRFILANSLSSHALLRF